MARWAECLSGKHKELAWIHFHTVYRPHPALAGLCQASDQKQGMVPHACSPSPEKLQTGGSLQFQAV